MTEQFQPDPDELLKAVQREEEQKKSGKLKIFFGMSAGVGKTYAMLEDAQRRLKEGVNIIAGTINTHGRKETEELLKGMPIIPEKWVNYRDVVFEEMDLEEILKQKPSIVLVDELAHTNVPGSRHSKRWQDVLEILDAGIDVYTTLNVQHLESRKDLVESITGILIRETVPDLILERASAIELIDIAPSELLERLKEGKVYLGMQSQIAAKNFFREDTLMALREIALRFTAEKVDHDLHTILSPGKGWKTREKLMVAVSTSPFSQKLIRITRRRAFELDAPWVAVYVDTGIPLTEEDKARLTSHLNLSQELGAEVVMTKDTDIATALQRIARQKHITQLVIGRRTNVGWKNYFQKSLIDRLEEENKQVDLLIIRQEQGSKSSIDTDMKYKRGLSPFRDYIWAFAAVAFITLLNHFFMHYVGYKAIGFIYMIGIVLLSHFLGQGPIFFVALLSTIAWDVFFTPPLLALSTSAGSEAVIMFIFFSTALVIGLLTGRLSKQELFLKMRERKLENLYEIEREIASASNYQNLRRNVSSHLQSIFNGQFDILVKGMDTPVVFDPNQPASQYAKEEAVIQWVFENGKIAGWSTSTLPSAAGLYIPIKFSQRTIGLLVFYPKREHPLSMEEMNFLQGVAQQLGIYLERHLFEERQVTQTFAAHIEKMQESVLQSVSKIFYPPIEKINEAAEKLSPLSEKDKDQVHIIEQAGKKLKFLIDNLISAAELESGFLHLNKEPHNLKEYIEHFVEELHTLLNERTVQLVFQEPSLTLSFDSRLMGPALQNLLLCVSHYAYPDSPIKVESKKEDLNSKIIFSARGEHLSQEELLSLFEKFNPESETPYQEKNFGLSITKSVIEIHQGQIKAYHLGEHEIAFEIVLPG